MAMANLEMPWSDRRKYDVPVGTAEDEVLAVMASMQSKGVKKIFIAGHSQGGLFALYFAGLHPVAGVIAIAPAGSVDSPLYREKLREPIERARNLFQQGKGQESDRFTDFEAGRGLFTVFTTAANYLSWFTPDGAMNQTQAIRSIKADIPVLFIAPTNDYPGLLMVKDSMFGALPKNPLSKLYEPNSNHLNAPVASTSEIENWIGLVAGK